MRKTVTLALVIGLCGLASSPQAAGIGDVLRDKVSGGGSSSALGGALGGGAGASALSAAGLVGPASLGNAAGVITYCMKNNYLNLDKAAQMKGQLLGKMGLGAQEEPKDEGYQSGLTGLITGSGGKSFDMDKIKGDLREKACDFVLDHAGSLL